MLTYYILSPHDASLQITSGNMCGYCLNNKKSLCKQQYQTSPNYLSVCVSGCFKWQPYK